jgi:membrane protease YdiL (CAAX protease family)
MPATRKLDSRTLEALALLPVTLALAVGLGIPTLWLVVPILWITLTRRPFEEYGLQIGDVGSWRLHAFLLVVVFGGYALLHYGFARLALGARFEPTLHPELGSLVVTHVLIIGLSEEVFFRGYLQSELNRSLGRPYQLWGARIGWGLVVASLLFGLCHVIYGDVSRIRVAFFGLFAGWLRERTDGVAVPAVYHGMANVLYDFMQRSMVIS